MEIDPNLHLQKKKKKNTPNVAVQTGPEPSVMSNSSSLWSCRYTIFFFFFLKAFLIDSPPVRFSLK